MNPRVRQIQHEQNIRHAALAVLEAADVTGEPLETVAARYAPRPTDIPAVVAQARRFNEEIDAPAARRALEWVPITRSGSCLLAHGGSSEYLILSGDGPDPVILTRWTRGTTENWALARDALLNSVPVSTAEAAKTVAQDFEYGRSVPDHYLTWQPEGAGS